MMSNFNSCVTAQTKNSKNPTTQRCVVGFFEFSGQKIETKEVVKELGIFMSNDGMFQHQINKIIEKAKNIISWILRTFTSRPTTAMTTLYKSFAIPILEYCSILWSPNTVGSKIISEEN